MTFIHYPAPPAARLAMFFAVLSGVTSIRAARNVIGKATSPAETRHSASEAAGARVYSERRGKFPEGAQQVAELLRFVTPYRTSMESFVDLTAYSPLLRLLRSGAPPPSGSGASAASAASAAASSLAEQGSNATAARKASVSLYAAVDTWVHDTRNEVETKAHFNSTQKRCVLAERPVKSDGNGWGLTADLVFWPLERDEVDTTPRHAVTLASGFFGSNYDIGAIDVIEGRAGAGGNTVHFDTPVSFRNTVDTACFRCRDGVESIQRAKWLAQSGQEIERAGWNGDQSAVDTIVQEAYNDYVSAHVGDATPVFGRYGSKVVRAKYDARKVSVKPGMPVYFQPADVAGETFRPVGTVLRGEGGTMTVRLDHPCFPPRLEQNMTFSLAQRSNKSLRGKSIGRSSLMTWLPRLWLPANPDVLTHANEISIGLTKQGVEVLTKAKASLQEFTESFAWPEVPEEAKPAKQSVGEIAKLLAESVKAWERMGPLAVVGSLDLGASDRRHTIPGEGFSLLQHEGDAASKVEVKEGDRMCVLKQDTSGRFFERRFDMPPMRPGDRALVQISVTGHGWDKTEEHCGEYCHSLYRLSFNDGPMMNVSLWRDDCHQNPLGPKQFGTWSEERNGWCPGSVAPGVFLDVTDSLQAHPSKSVSNLAALDLAVWSEDAREFAPFTNFMGFLNDDSAQVTTSLNLFVYDRLAVEKVRSQPHAYTAAERALRDGVSRKDALNNPMESAGGSAGVLGNSGFADPGPEPSFLQVQEEKKRRRTRPRVLQGQREFAAPPRAYTLKDNSAKAASGARRPVPTVEEVARDRLMRTPASAAARTPAAAAASSAGEVLAKASSFLSVVEAREVQPAAASTQGKRERERYNFEQGAPWYLWPAFEQERREEGHSSEAARRHTQVGGGLKAPPSLAQRQEVADPAEGALRVPLFRDAYINGYHQTAEGLLKDIPEKWARVALHLKVEKPKGEGLEVDFWDRLGSIGLLLHQDGPGLELHPHAENVPHESFTSSVGLRA